MSRIYDFFLLSMIFFLVAIPTSYILLGAREANIIGTAGLLWFLIYTALERKFREET